MWLHDTSRYDMVLNTISGLPLLLSIDETEQSTNNDMVMNGNLDTRVKRPRFPSSSHETDGRSLLPLPDFRSPF